MARKGRHEQVPAQHGTGHPHAIQRLNRPWNATQQRKQAGIEKGVLRIQEFRSQPRGVKVAGGPPAGMSGVPGERSSFVPNQASTGSRPIATR